MNTTHSVLSKEPKIDILESYSLYECPNMVSCTHMQEDNFMGVQFSVTSSVLTQLLKPFKLKKGKSSNKNNTFGDDFWMFIFEPIAIEVPTTLEKFKTWLIAYFELFGTTFFINDDKDENYEIVTARKRHRITKVITSNIDKIMESLESFSIATITYNYRTGDTESDRVVYENKNIIASEVEDEELNKFMNDFDVEIAIGAWA